MRFWDGQQKVNEPQAWEWDKHLMHSLSMRNYVILLGNNIHDFARLNEWKQKALFKFSVLNYSDNTLMMHYSYW